MVLLLLAPKEASNHCAVSNLSLAVGSCIPLARCMGCRTWLPFLHNINAPAALVSGFRTTVNSTSRADKLCDVFGFASVGFPPGLERLGKDAQRGCAADLERGWLMSFQTDTEEIMGNAACQVIRSSCRNHAQQPLSFSIQHASVLGSRFSLISCCSLLLYSRTHAKETHHVDCFPLHPFWGCIQPFLLKFHGSGQFLKTKVLNPGPLTMFQKTHGQSSLISVGIGSFGQRYPQ